ncbi:MAG: hypothetical protein LH478_07275 [Chitinophagaceae bacterium]|nr:hypothetical protein [Chitinophagaceae bacterium]
MKPISLPLPSLRLIQFSLLSFLLVFASCKVQLVSNYDMELSNEINNTAKKVDNFYLTMQEIAADKRQFVNFSTSYIGIEVDLNSLVIKNRVRPLNAESTRIAEITLQLWEKYKEEHKKDNTLSNGLIRLNKKTFSDMFYAMQVAEEGKKVSNSPNP